MEGGLRDTDSGVLLVDKPAGPSSNAVLQRTKRLLGVDRFVGEELREGGMVAVRHRFGEGRLGAAHLLLQLGVGLREHRRGQQGRGDKESNVRIVPCRNFGLG